ncbi:hypothetical protein NRI_0099 [Neorickettsia risticii str. Illinois]|uniref:Uncharacterized protein n=1 Tax=Neorickettsia risticii (strain Illinois) TaxID=434131 RepID=C6V3Y0_NEORI|nr:hypothetical protein NRI_0099 [Neorickettsia risticii str. Illinois]
MFPEQQFITGIEKASQILEADDQSAILPKGYTRKETALNGNTIIPFYIHIQFYPMTSSNYPSL